MRDSVRKSGLPVPSFGQLLLLAAICTAGWWGWQAYCQIHLRRQLWNPAASATDRMQAIELWASGGAASVDELLRLLVSVEARNRRDAARTLGRIGTSAVRAAPALMNAMRDTDPLVRAAAIKATSQIDPDAPEFPGRLIVAATDEDPMVRDVARDALLDAGMPMLPLLMPLLKHPKPVIRVEIMRLVRRAAPGSPDVVAALRRMAQDREPSVRAEAAICLLRDRRASPEEVLSWMLDEDAAVVSASLAALSQFGSDAVMAVPELIQCLERSDPHFISAGVSWVALDWLRSFGPAARPAIPALLRLLQSRERAVETAAILETLEAVGAERETLVSVLVPALGEPDAAATAAGLLAKVAPDEARRQVPPLIEKLRASDEADRRTALGMLHAMGPAGAEAVPAVAALLSEDSGSIAYLATAVLAGIGPDAGSAVPEIVKQIRRHGHSPAIEVLIYAVGRIGPGAAAASPLLMEIVADANHPPAVRGMAIQSITRIGSPPPEFVASLRSLLTADDSHLCPAVLHALATCVREDESLLAPLLRCLLSSAEENSCAAAWTIGDIVGCRAEVVAALAGLMDDRVARLRWVAARALGRLGPCASAALPALRSALLEKENVESRYWYAPQFTSRPAIDFRLQEGREPSVAEVVIEAIRQIAPEEGVFAEPH